MSQSNAPSNFRVSDLVERLDVVLADHGNAPGNPYEGVIKYDFARANIDAGAHKCTFVNTYYIDSNGKQHSLKPIITNHERLAGNIKPKTQDGLMQAIKLGYISAEVANSSDDPLRGNSTDPTIQVQKWQNCILEADANGEAIDPGPEYRSMVFAFIEHLDRGYQYAVNEKLDEGREFIKLAMSSEEINPEKYTEICMVIGNDDKMKLMTELRKQKGPAAIERKKIIDEILNTRAIIAPSTKINSSIQTVLGLKTQSTTASAGDPLLNPLARLKVRVNRKNGKDGLEGDIAANIFDASDKYIELMPNKEKRTRYRKMKDPTNPKVSPNEFNIHNIYRKGSFITGSSINVCGICFSSFGISFGFDFGSPLVIITPPPPRVVMDDTSIAGLEIDMPDCAPKNPIEPENKTGIAEAKDAIDAIDSALTPTAPAAPAADEENEIYELMGTIEDEPSEDENY